VACRSFAHSKQVPLKVRMDMADISCPDNNGSYSLFHTSTEKMTHVTMDAISDLNNYKISEICHFEGN